jgi:hypothetical protein
MLVLSVDDKRLRKNLRFSERLPPPLIEVYLVHLKQKYYELDSRTSGFRIRMENRTKLLEKTDDLFFQGT